MTLVNVSPKLALAGFLVSAAMLSVPASVSAYGYYHYVAPDIKFNNVWPSADPVKRLYYHHTDGGWGASVQFETMGANFDWVWVHLQDNGSGVYVGYTKKYGCDIRISVMRFNDMNWGGPADILPGPGGWSRYAAVGIEVSYKGEMISAEFGLLCYRDQDWDPE